VQFLASLQNCKVVWMTRTTKCEGYIEAIRHHFFSCDFVWSIELCICWFFISLQRLWELNWHFFLMVLFEPKRNVRKRETEGEIKKSFWRAWLSMKRGWRMLALPRKKTCLKCLLKIITFCHHRFHAKQNEKLEDKFYVNKSTLTMSILLLTDGATTK
jgi:hypothetical protein